MKKFKIWQPIASGFQVEIKAETEDEAIDLFRQGAFNYTDVSSQILQNQQTNGMPQILA